MRRITLTAAYALLAALNTSTQATDVVHIARSFKDGGGYHWKPGNSGARFGVYFRGEEVLAPGEGTFCCGFTFEVAMRAASERGLLEGKSIDEVRRFQKLWYGSTDEDQETLVVYAAEQLGVGHRVTLDEALPGDFMQFWRGSGSGHSVVFLGWVEDEGRRVGFRYRSSQGSTDGIGDKTEYFEDAPRFGGGVVRARTYLCRLDPAESPEEMPQSMGR